MTPGGVVAAAGMREPVSDYDVDNDAEFPVPSSSGHNAPSPRLSRGSILAAIDDSEHAAVSDSVGEALRVVARCHGAGDSVGLIENMRYVSEIFGFRIRVRGSQYVDSAPPHKCLRAATIECPEVVAGVNFMPATIFPSSI